MNKNKGSILGFLGFIALFVVGFFLFTPMPSAILYILTALLLATAAIFGIAKVAEYLKLKATVSADKGLEPGELRERLAAVEQQLVEVQDVMIALSEKIDYMERQKLSRAGQEQREQG